MSMTPQIIDTLISSAMMAPAIALGQDPAPAAGGAKGGDAVMKAVGIGFLVLVLVNGQLSSGMTFALIAGIIAYFYFSKK